MTIGNRPAKLQTTIGCRNRAPTSQWVSSCLRAFVVILSVGIAFLTITCGYRWKETLRPSSRRGRPAVRYIRAIPQ